MNDRVNSSYRSSNTNKKVTNVKSNIGIVIDVILDDSHKRLLETDIDIFGTGKDTYDIGSCVIRPLHNQVSAESNLNVYPPYDLQNIDLPLKGEAVELIKLGNVTHYKRINKGNLNIGNAIENFNKNVFEDTESDSNNASSYSKTSKTGITNTSGTNDRDTKIGEYFEESQTNRLKLYEGDKLFQSRFGQSIRFSGYNNADNKYAPTILIRNRQNAISLNELESGDITEEDVNTDGSIIAITSGNYKLTFQPGTVDDGGGTNFETKPKHFTEYPSELIGMDQILINSDRLIFSSKAAEMIFYSKGNWGFISDGKMSIDNGKAGAELDFNGDVIITTNDNDVKILGGKGNIFLNTEETKEPLVRGQVLVDLMKELLDAINSQIFSTPSGPTLKGPNNRGDFTKIKSKLDTFLSTQNFTE